MNTNLLTGLLFFFFSMFTMQHVYADDEPPFIGGNYWEVTGVKVADGAGLKYAKWLASEWRENLEFSKSEGWLEDYYIISNVHSRSDEPDLYIVRVFKNMASVEENEQRRKKYLDWVKKSMDKMQSESGDRAEYRTIMSTSLLQEMKFRE
ncbi:hypothetical protein FE810_16125 [Thalassotalea litorea]|uniref:Uncharacterized protein n=1 Tax=Thalassotalea litorea TaxID=2020715 RepID=A0A5R9IEP3_9GAMM|nr:hypothetical protein [Thalassotalea litorea]TLU61034.1 hypothetical protein FE810_16125 [Thalassotalea litorea]